MSTSNFVGNNLPARTVYRKIIGLITFRLN